MYTSNLSPVLATLGEDSRTLHVSVLFTDVPATLEALNKAAKLSAGLNAEIELLAPEEMPYPLPLDQHPVRREYAARRLRAITGRINAPLRIHVIYCRDRTAAVRRYLKRKSPLVVAWRRRWFFDATSHLVRALRREGYHVITTDERGRRIDVGPVLHRSLWAILRGLLGLDEGLRSALGR